MVEQDAGSRCTMASRRDQVTHSFAVAAVSLLLLALVAKPTLATPFAMRSHHLAINQGLEGRNIRNLECISRKTQEKGTCMFALTCLKLNGTHLGVCVDRFYYGSCCRLPEDHVLDVGNVETNVISSAPGGPFVKPNKPPVTAASVVEDESSTTSRPTVTTKRTPTTASKPPSATQKPTTPVRKPSITTKRPEIPPKPVTTKPIAEATTQKQPAATTPKPVATTPTKRPISKPTTVAASTKPPAATTPTKRPVTAKPSTAAKPSNTTTRPGTTKPPAKPATTAKPQAATTPKPAVNTPRPASTVKPTTKPIPKPTPKPTPKPVSVPASTQKPSTTVTQKPVVTTISNEVEPSIRPTKVPIVEAVEVESTSTKPSTSRPALSTPKPTPSTPKPTPSTAKPTPSTDKPVTTKPTARPTPPTFPRPSSTTEKPPVTSAAIPVTTVATTTVAPPESSSVTDGEWVQIDLSTTAGTVSGATPTTPSQGSIFTEEIPTSGPATPPTFPSTVSTTEPGIELSLNMSDYKQVCGRRLFPESRIVGGTRTTFGKWPWQISLRQWRTSTYLHKCGAALLNENWAITAAHCVENVPPSDLLLRLGEHDLSTESEPYAHLERRVQIVASHPQFDSRTFEYDLALLRFYEPVDFKPNVVPICIPDNDKNFVGEDAYVTGWGRLYEDGPLPSVMQQVSVPVIENAMCETMYRSAGYIEHIPNIFICAGWKKGGFDSCEGDSGGPMVIQREDKRWVLAGVISWGIGCAEPNQPGVYTRISEFRDWINQILQF